MKIENFSAELSRLERVDSVAKWEKLATVLARLRDAARFVRSLLHEPGLYAARAEQLELARGDVPRDDRDHAADAELRSHHAERERGVARGALDDRVDAFEIARGLSVGQHPDRGQRLDAQERKQVHQLAEDPDVLRAKGVQAIGQLDERDRRIVVGIQDPGSRSDPRTLRDAPPAPPCFRELP